MRTNLETDLDIERLRAETPGCAHVLHLNSAGSSLMPRPVLDAVTRYLQREAEIGGYEAREGLDAVYASVARLIGAAPDEIAVVENATRGFDMAFYAIPFQPGDIILTSVAEYGSNYLAYLQVARRTGAEIRVVPNDESGQLDVAALQRMIDGRTKLIAIAHMPSSSGLVQPAEEIGRVARRAGVLYLLDACQSVGQMPVDVQRIGCDMLAASARKFLRGPRGVGFLYVCRDVAGTLEPPFIDMVAATWIAPDAYELAPAAKRFENFEGNIAGKLGMGAAVEYALALGLEPIQARVCALAEALRAELRALPGVRVWDWGEVHGANVSFTLETIPAFEVPPRLRAHGINVSALGRRGTLLELEQKGIPAIVSASPHYFNTEDELDRFLWAVRELA